MRPRPMWAKVTMDRTPVDSTNVESVGYDPGTATLEIEFKNGGIYQYFGVPDQVHSDLMNAPSKGLYFNANIRNAYPLAKL